MGNSTLEGGLLGSHEGTFSEVMNAFPFEVVAMSSLTTACSEVVSELEEFDSVEIAVSKDSTL